MDNILFDYALMSVSAYMNVRNRKNQVSPSSDWQPLPGPLGHTSNPSGFEAVAYQNGNDIVIAYTGTDELWDWWTNIGGTTGTVVTDPMKEAARFYAEVFRANPNANITFTGHSMGGGLAGLMGVLFNRPAYTFDPAPFRASANHDTRRIIKDYLGGLIADDVGLPLAQALDGFRSDRPASDLNPAEPFGSGIRGDDHVRRYVVMNEAVSRWAPDSFIGTRGVNRGQPTISVAAASPGVAPESRRWRDGGLAHLYIVNRGQPTISVAAASPGVAPESRRWRDGGLAHLHCCHSVPIHV